MVIVLFAIFLIAGIFLFSQKKEGIWVCEKGKWIALRNPLYPKPDDPCGQKITMPRSKEKCLKIGGVWKKQGPEPFETCNLKAKDRGTVCHDNNECQGWCQVDLTRDELSKSMQGQSVVNKKFGQCSVWVIELGCFGMMEKGKTKAICID